MPPRQNSRLNNRIFGAIVWNADQETISKFGKIENRRMAYAVRSRIKNPTRPFHANELCFEDTKMVCYRPCSFREFELKGVEKTRLAATGSLYFENFNLTKMLESVIPVLTTLCKVTTNIEILENDTINTELFNCYYEVIKHSPRLHLLTFYARGEYLKSAIQSLALITSGPNKIGLFELTTRYIDFIDKSTADILLEKIDDVELHITCVPRITVNFNLNMDTIIHMFENCKGSINITVKGIFTNAKLLSHIRRIQRAFPHAVETEVGNFFKYSFDHRNCNHTFFIQCKNLPDTGAIIRYESLVAECLICAYHRSCRIIKFYERKMKKK